MTLIVGLAAASAAPAGQAPTLDQVLARSAAYVVRHYSRVTGIVVEETYQQEARELQRGVSRSTTPRQRLLKSDLLLVRPPDTDRYVEFRDVFEVNGTAVRDREQRLANLFLTPTQASADTIKAIVDESARHNVGNVMRNVNTPMLSLHFLLPHVQKRFRFERREDGSPELGNATDFPGRESGQFRAPAGAWVVQYRETSKPTLIKTDGGADFPVTGRFWVHPESGVVLLSEIVFRGADVLAVIAVAYQLEPTLGVHVPVEMRERYRTSDERVEGVATYGRFRQFSVKTDTILTKPPG